MIEKTILHLCADIGSDSKIWKDNGFNVIQVGKDIGVENFNPPKSVYGIIANPVCTEFSNANTSKNKIKNIDNGMFLVNECLRIINSCNCKFWIIENPATGDLKLKLGAPQYIYQPWWFGSPWNKKTALWGKFNIPKRIFYNYEDVPKNDKLYCRPNRKIPSLAFMHKNAIFNIPEFEPFIKLVHDDMHFRSLCSQKFMQEFYNANCNL